MIPLLRTHSIKKLENQAQQSQSLTQEAGHALANYIKINLSQYRTVLYLLGPGMKGIDGLYAIESLLEKNIAVSILTTYETYESVSKRFSFSETDLITYIFEWPKNKVDMVIDGLFGTGFNKPLAPPYSNWLAEANQIDAFKLAIDIPSGLNADTGIADQNTFRSDLTYSFIAAKIGQYTADGPDYCGNIIQNNLGVLYQPDGYLVNRASKQYSLSRRKNSHKGNFGNIAILGGATGMLGAPLLSAHGALYSGAGRVWITPFTQQAENLIPIHHPQIMTATLEELQKLPLDCLIVGPGSHEHHYTFELLESLISLPCTLILDAGVLTLINHESIQQRLLQRKFKTILTPHPGEGKNILKRPIVDRVNDALEIAKKFNSWVVLKGQGTIIASPKEHWWINASGNASLAIPGSGDMLCGIMAGLICQSRNDYEGILNAVHFHGNAGDQFTLENGGTVGMDYHELLHYVRTSLNQLGDLTQT